MDVRQKFGKRSQDERNFSSQSTVVSDTDEDVDTAISISTNRIQNLYYHRLQSSSTIPFLPLLKQLFFICDNCKLNGEMHCWHPENPSYKAIIALRNEFSSADLGHHFVSSVSANVPIVKIPSKLTRCFEGFDVKKDGNCLFSAVSFGLCLDTVLAKSLRRCGLMSLKFNLELQEKLSKLKPDQIAAQMKILTKDSKWGTSHTIFILSDVISRPIIVYNFLERKNENGKKGKKGRKIFGALYDAGAKTGNRPLYLWLEDKHFMPLILRNYVSNPPVVKYVQGDLREVLKGERLHEYLKACHSFQDDDEEEAMKPTCLTESLAQQDTFYDNLGEFEYSHQTSTKCSDTNSENAHKFPASLKELKSTRLFRSMDEIYYSKVLRYLKVELEDLDSEESSLEAISNFVNSTDSWNFFAARILKDRKLSPTKTRSISRNIYYKQRSLAGRKQFAKMMMDASVDSKKIQAYFDLCNTKFGLLSYSVADFKTELFENQTTQPHDVQFEKRGNEFANYDDTPINSVETTRDSDDEHAANFKASLSDCEISYDDNSSEVQCSQHEIIRDDNRSPSTVISNEMEDNTTDNSDTEELEAMCDIFDIQRSDLKYQPPISFKIKLHRDDVNEKFNFETMEFETGKWPRLINDAFGEANIVCSFNAERSPSYPKRKSGIFCRMNGKCGGNCKMKFTVIIPKAPKKGKHVKCSVTSVGAFHLLQSKSTGRQIRGEDRDAIKADLKLRKPKAVFLDSIQHVPGLKALHRNNPQKSESSLRKIKSEIRTDNQLDPDPGKEILLLREQFKNEDKSHKICMGYIHHINITPENFQLLLYTRKSLNFHSSQVKKGFNTCFLDATGSVMKKVSSKTPLLYSLMGRNNSNITYPIADFVSEEGTNLDIMYLISRIKRHMLQLHKNSERPFTNILVVDWSWSLLHGVCKGVNTQELSDYIRNSWNILNGEKWDTTHTCIFICTSHLIAACKRLFSKRLTKTKKDRSVLELALHAVARTQETFNLKEFQETLTIIVRTFGLENINQNELSKNISSLMKPKPWLEVIIKSEVDPEVESFKQKDIKFPKTIRDDSPFFVTFNAIKLRELSGDTELAAGGIVIENPYFCPSILKLFGNHKIPMYPFWGAAIPRATQNPTFLRESNSVVESSFNIRKNVYESSKNQSYPEYVKISHRYHHSTLREAMDKIVQRKSRKTESSSSDEDDVDLFSSTRKSRVNRTELKDEKWMKHKSNNRKSLHFSNRPSLYIPSTEQLASKNIQRMRKDNQSFLPKFGLPNIGNTCYLNAAFQVLMTLPLTLNQHEFSGFQLPWEVYFRGIHSRKITSFMAKTAKDEVDSITKYKFPTGPQHDAHEFLKCVLELDEFVYLKAEMSVVIKTIVKCNGCSKISSSFQPEYELIIQPDETIMTAFGRFGNDELLGDYKCTKCGGTAIRKSIIEETSEYLVVITQLVKTGDGFLGNSQPSLKTVIRNSYLDPQIDVSTQVGRKRYVLHSFITHAGRFIKSGHYRAFIMDKEKFICCDDADLRSKNDYQGDIYVRIYREQKN